MSRSYVGSMAGASYRLSKSAFGLISMPKRKIEKRQLPVDTVSVYCDTADGALRMVRLTIRISDELHEKICWLSYQERKSQQVIVLEIGRALSDVKVPKEAKS